MIVGTDYATKWCEEIATRDKSSKTVLKFLIKEIFGFILFSYGQRTLIFGT